MNDISQEELEALTKSVQEASLYSEDVTDNKSEDGSSPEVTLYDFARPDKFSKEQIRTLEMIHTNCGRNLSTKLSALLYGSTDAELESISEVNYLDFIETAQSPAVVSLLSLKPLSGRGLLVLEPQMAFALMDRMLGGPGIPPEQIRELTEIEKGLIERVITIVLKCIEESWRTLLPLKPELEMIMGSNILGQIALPEDRLMVARFRITCRDITGNLEFGIPATALDPVLSKLNAQQLFLGVHSDTDTVYAQDIQHSLESSELEVVALLGHATVNVGDLLDLQVGDLISLDQTANSDLDILVDSQSKFRGRPGQIGRRLAISITQLVEEEDSQNG